MGWVVPGRLNQLTGGYLYDARMIAGLRARGHDVRVTELPSARWPIDPFASAWLVRALRGASLDAVVIDELAHPAMILGVPGLRALARGDRSPLVVALVHHLRCSEPAPRAARRWAALIERAALAGIDLGVCTSPTTEATLRRVLRHGVPIEVVAPGRDLAGGTTDGGRRATGERSSIVHRRSAPPSSRRLRVLTVAHWTSRKGIVETLRALALTPPAISLDLVGDQDRDPTYAARVHAELRRPELQGRVRAHGQVSSDRLARLYEQADAFLLASSHEGYGMVLAEAMAAGLPIVATRVGAVPAVARHGREAELVGRGDVAGLARALERLAHDPAERRRRSAWARERAASLPTWEGSCATFAGILEGAVGSTPRPDPSGAQPRPAPLPTFGRPGARGGVSISTAPRHGDASVNRV